MLTRICRFLGCVLCAVAVAGGTFPNSIDPEMAAKFFHEAKTLNDHDNGKLWGTPLLGPMLFVDAASRSAVANEQDANRTFQRSKDMWVGRLSEAIPVANTAVEWSGSRWTMVEWPLPDNRHARETLMMHECFHRIQKDLGLDIRERPCEHLDSKEGRIWLQMEWRALRKALLAQGPGYRRAIRDALLFRAYRRSLFPGAAEAERDMELNEGLAEYTGVRLSAKSEAQAVADALVGLDLGARKPTFVRSSGYASGPAYGLLLDRSAPGWRHHVKERPDLGDLLSKALAFQIAPHEKGQALHRAASYGLEDLVEDEIRREEARKLRMATFEAILVDGPVLILPRTEGFRYSFNPNHLLPLEKRGMVYPAIQASGPWGTLDASGGALMAPEDLRVPAPENPASRPLKGANWTLTLQPGWGLVPDSRNGDWRLVQEATPPAASGPAK